MKNYLDKWNEDSVGDENVKVLVISGDKDKEGYDATMNDSPWVSLPYGDKYRRDQIIKLKKKDNG